MPKKKGYAQKKYPREKAPTEKELITRLGVTVLAIIVTLGVLYASISFFGPKIGSLFGLISRHRNEDGNDDVLAPAPPIFSSAPTATKEEVITLNGLSEPGATVKLFVNGPEAKTAIADSEGLFTFPDIRLIDGNNVVFAKAEDQSGNESPKSVTLNIRYDNDSPEVKITSPSKGETIKNLNKRVLVSGELNEKATVKVNGRVAVVKPDLTFEILMGVEEGNVEIKVVATDEAGNSKEEKIYINYLKSS